MLKIQSLNDRWILMLLCEIGGDLNNWIKKVGGDFINDEKVRCP